MLFDRTELHEVVTRPQKTLVYAFGCDRRAGFGAAYLGFLGKLIWCLQNGVGFRFAKVHQPVGFITARGWTDYFEPFCEEADGPLLELLDVHAFPFARRMPFVKTIAGAWLRATTRPKADFFSFDSLSDVPKGTTAYRFDDYLVDRRALIDSLWCYTTETAAEVSYRKTPVARSSGCTAICIRRGDKLMEHDYVDLGAYVKCLREMPAEPVFVASDDYSVVEYLRSTLADREVLSLTESGTNGYVHADFKKLTTAQRRSNTVRFFAQLEMLRDARIFIGSKTTNVSWVTNAMRAGEGVIWID